MQFKSYVDQYRVQLVGRLRKVMLVTVIGLFDAKYNSLSARY